VSANLIEELEQTMIIVTGGAGFIGSALIAALNRRQIEDILVVDILGTDERWKNLRHLRYADYVEADDFLGMISADSADWKVEAVIHMGACSDTTETDCTYLVKNNYEYSKITAQWAVAKGARFIYASSGATYGEGSQGFSDDESALEKLRPLNMYGYSKHMFDLWAKRAGLLTSIVGLKYFNVFGPNEYHKGNMRSFVLKAFEQIDQRGKVGLFRSYKVGYADGEQKRDFLYIKDAVEMTLFFLDNPEANGIFNIGTSNARTWNELAMAVFAAMGEETVIDYIPMPEELKEKYQYFTEADITKLKNAGYDKETTTLENAIEDYVQNYLVKDEYLGAE
jgi:ADP-L-glycero-D-manno-heptose 6-epimerase